MVDFEADLKKSLLDKEKDRSDHSEPDMKMEIVDVKKHKKEIKKRKRSISRVFGKKRLAITPSEQQNIESIQKATSFNKTTSFESQKEGTENTNDESENLDLLLELKVHEIEPETENTNKCHEPQMQNTTPAVDQSQETWNKIISEKVDNNMKGLLTEPNDEVMKYGAISNSPTYPQLYNEHRTSAITVQIVKNVEGIKEQSDQLEVKQSAQCQYSNFKEKPQVEEKQSVIKSNPYKFSQETHQHYKVRLNEGNQDEKGILIEEEIQNDDDNEEKEILKEEQIQNDDDDDEKDEDNLQLINENLKIDIPQDEADINVQSGWIL